MNVFNIIKYTNVWIDEGSDKEASAESETEKSTEDEETSESETVSGSQSESEEVYSKTILELGKRRVLHVANILT